MRHWEITYHLYRNGARVPGLFYDYWHSVGPVVQHTQERFWKRIHPGYTIDQFACNLYTGDEPNPRAHRELSVGTY